MPLNLYKRPNGIWHIRGSVQGQVVDESARTRKRGEAEQIRSQREQDLFKRSVYGDDAVATFAEAVELYLPHGDPTYLAPLVEALGDKLVGEITQADLDAVAKARLRPVKDDDGKIVMVPLKPSTIVRQIHVPVTAVINFAASDAGGRLCRPVKFRKPKVQAPAPDFLKPAEAEALLDSLPPHMQRIVTFMLASGCRVTEAIDLTWSEVSDDLTRIIFNQTKGGYARSFDLQERARKLLPARPKQRMAHVFLTSEGLPWTDYRSLNHYFDRHAEKAGNEHIRAVHNHLFRHTWATWAYACTKDLTFLMAQGGWRQITMVQHYAHAASPGLARDVLAKGWEFGGREHR